MIPGHPVLYHATRMDYLPSILKEGLKTTHYGKIHGQMAIRPPCKCVYLSRHKNSNNLNSNLFESDPKLVVLEISTDDINLESIYPDDALFCGFGNEDVFEDADEIVEATGWSLEKSEAFLKELEKTPDIELANKMKFLWPWYLEEHGEIAVAQDIPASSIVRIRNYSSGKIIFPPVEYKNHVGVSIEP